MKLISKNSEKDAAVVELSLDEAGAILSVLNDVLDGPYAIPDEEWSLRVMQAREIVSDLSDDFVSILKA